MLIGVGCDLVLIKRAGELLQKSGVAKVFTEGELEYINSRGAFAPSSAAGIFAAKEAVLKALGTGIKYRLTDIGISHEPAGRPVAVLSGKLAGDFADVRLSLSISHEGDYAMAFVVAERD